MSNYDYLVVGSGLYGAVFAREATRNGLKCLVIDKRNSVGGNVTDGPNYIYQRNPDGSENTAVLNSYVGANKSITLPSQIKEIENLAFESCDITSVTLNNGLEKIGKEVFARNQISVFDLPSSVTTIGENAFFKWNYSNPNLTKIINRTGKAFDWTNILDTSISTPQVFVTGTATTKKGDVEITDN